MKKKILDLHIHSKYSRACSKNLELPSIAKACETRGIDIVVTSDFTHPAWFSDIKEQLVEDTEGVYKLKDDSSKTRFIIGTEIASIKKHKDKTRRVHLLVFAPSIEVAEKFNNALDARGINLTADGRPIIGMPSKDILELMLEIDERMVMIPAHAWTPWFGVFGSKGGYNSMEEAFDDLAPHIFAIETGLSSDPLMNWRCSWLDNIALVSNSDAHSTPKLGREANVLQFEDNEEVTYTEIMRIIRDQDKHKFIETLEFYPEEGKYHHDGHRACNFSCEPEETKKRGNMCPVCKKPLVIGVLNRVHELADRTEEQARAAARIPYKSIFPLPEVLADVYQVGPNTKRVKTVYDELIEKLGSEFHILLDASIKDIEKASSAQVARAIDRMRKGEVFLSAGFDGEFGVVKVFGEDEDRGWGKQTELLI